MDAASSMLEKAESKKDKLAAWIRRVPHWTAEKKDKQSKEE